MAAAASLGFAGTPPRELGVVEVARARGWHRHTARAWMREIEARWGAQFVYRRRGRLYTTDLALELLLATSSERRVEARLRDHEERLGELERARVAVGEQLLTLLRALRLPGGIGARLRKG